MHDAKQHPRAAEIRSRLETYLKGKDFHFNPDEEALDAILNALAMRFERYGHDYCPCRRVSGNPEEDAKIVCPCAYHIQEIAEDGHCHCFLFAK